MSVINDILKIFILEIHFNNDKEDVEGLEKDVKYLNHYKSEVCMERIEKNVK